MGAYSQVFASGTRQIQFLQPGNYVLDNGAGGPDVGPFRAALTVPAKPFSATVQRSVAGVRQIEADREIEIGDAPDHRKMRAVDVDGSDVAVVHADEE